MSDAATPVPAQHEFAQPVFSQDADFTRGEWGGTYNCLFGQYSAQFPHPEAAARLHISGYKEGAVILTRVDYGMGVMANIVMSSLPEGRLPGAEMNRQLDLALAHEEALGRSMNIEPRMTPHFGHLLCMTIKDVVASPAEGPYPLVMAFHESAGPARTVSVHRVFARGSNRFEIAVFQQLPHHMAPSVEHERQMLNQVTAIAQHILVSMTG